MELSTISRSKKDGTFTPVIDFRRVSAVTLDEHYPLPVLSDLLMSLDRTNSIFLNLDLLSGYWQVELGPVSQYAHRSLRNAFWLKISPINVPKNDK